MVASRGDREGWWLVGAGAACLVADVVIDFIWAHPTVSKSDQPNLNRPAAQLVGRVLIVAEAIEGGRGKVRVGDTLWPVEGPDVAGRRRGQGDGLQGDRAGGGAGLYAHPVIPEFAEGESPGPSAKLALGPGYFAARIPG